MAASGVMSVERALRSPWTRPQGAVVIIRVVVPVLSFWAEGWGALLGGFVFQEAGFWLARRIGGPDKFARALFAFAYALRAVLAVSVHEHQKLFTPNGALFQDDYTSDLVSEWLVRIARAEGVGIYVGHAHVLDSMYTYFLASLYGLLGYAPLLPKLLNVTLGALGTMLVFAIARGLTTRTAARGAGLAAALLPSSVLWSLVTLKEVPILVAVLVCLRGLQVAFRTPARSREFANAITAVLAALILMADLRQPVALLLLALGITLLLARFLALLPRRTAAACSVAAAMVVVVVGLTLRFTAPDSTLGKLTQSDVLLREARYRRATEALAARSQFAFRLDGWDQADTEGRLLILERELGPVNVRSDLLEPLGFVLFAPAPWQARTAQDAAASVEMIGWYVLYIGVVLRVTRKWDAASAMLLGYGAGVFLLLAFSEGNTGNLIRHRLMATPPVLVLGTAGLYDLWRWLLSRARVRHTAAGSSPTVASGSLPARGAPHEQ